MLDSGALCRASKPDGRDREGVFGPRELQAGRPKARPRILSFLEPQADCLRDGLAIEIFAFDDQAHATVLGKRTDVIEKLARKGVLGGVPAARLSPDNPDLADLIIVASTEVNTDEDRAAYAKALKEVLA